MKGVQCYELFGGIALKNHAFSFFFFLYRINCVRVLTVIVSALRNASLNRDRHSFFTDWSLSLH